MAEQHYESIRDLLGAFIGDTIVDITQHDREEWFETGESRVYLHFASGRSLIFPIGDAGFDIEDPSAEDEEDTNERRD